MFCVIQALALASQAVELGSVGEDDQLGTLNLITPEKRRQAAALVKEGFSDPRPLLAFVPKKG